MKYPLFKLAILVAGLCLGAVSASAQYVGPDDGHGVAFLGGPNTFWGSRGPEGYAYLIQNTLDKQGEKITMIGEGAYDNSAQDLLTRFQNDILKKKPEWLVVAPESSALRDLDLFKKSISGIVDQATAAGIKVLLLTAALQEDDPASAANRKIAPFNDYLRSLAKDKNVQLADVYADMQAERAKMKAQYPTLTGVVMVDGSHGLSDGISGFGEQAFASSILKAWGVSDTDLAAAKAEWMNVPGAMEIPIKDAFSVEDYLKLCAAASAQKKSVGDLLNDTATKEMQAYLAAHPAPAATP